MTLAEVAEALDEDLPQETPARSPIWIQTTRP